MEQDLATLQVISETLKEAPQASQRTLAKKANMSLGMMNAILGRFVERGWIMLTNVNGRKLAYAVTPDGIAELAERGRKFVKRTFAIANKYNEVLFENISKAKADGKKKVILYGKSYIKFLIEYVCKVVDIEFLITDVLSKVDDESFCIIGELEDDAILSSLIQKGYVSILDIVQNSGD